MSPSFSIAVHALRARRGRSVLTLAGLAVACAFLTTALGISRGVDAALRTAAERSFVSGEVIIQPGLRAPTALERAVPLGDVLEQENPRAELNDALLETLRADPRVAQAVGQSAFPYPVTARIEIFDMRFEIDLPLFVVDDGFYALLGGTPPKDGESAILASQRLLDLYNLGLTSGSDLPRLRPEGLVGLAFDAEVGFSSFLQQRPLGITSMRKMRIAGFTDQPTLLGATIGRTDAEAVLRGIAPGATIGGAYRTVLAVARDDTAAAALAQELRAEGYRATTVTELLAGVSSSSAVVTVAVGILAGIVLLLALLTVATTMLTATVERTAEIGILRSIGATRGDVVGQFLIEAAILGLVGGVLGLGAGLLGADAGIALLLRALPETSMLASLHAGRDAVVLLAPIVSGVLVALLGALPPSIIASRMSPVRALHTSH